MTIGTNVVYLQKRQLSHGQEFFFISATQTTDNTGWRMTK
ncbi:hypothetical protein M132_2974 [Bacteroides fragilis str. S24L15]|nr:hypothetical protein M072_3002 [Bacteroides fragilis str. DS-208]EYA70368.1 hypothetical protein M132_2974 [Bacteroides fragilis str. S24L15]EYA74931.1 hypothetical protein M133_3063 [Bacteroides fragilis str. S24L26]EYA79460.1 hypothetical protein M134_3199 [Bacteroides fragilis str. S24L34]